MFSHKNSKFLRSLLALRFAPLYFGDGFLILNLKLFGFLLMSFPKYTVGSWIPLISCVGLEIFIGFALNLCSNFLEFQFGCCLVIYGTQSLMFYLLLLYSWWFCLCEKVGMWFYRRFWIVWFFVGLFSEIIQYFKFVECYDFCSFNFFEFPVFVFLDK